LLLVGMISLSSFSGKIRVAMAKIADLPQA
jgi:hypothetical protein